MNPMLLQLRDETYADAGAAWIITKDHIEPGEHSAVGTAGPRTMEARGSWPSEVEFQLLDDDGELYYSGVLHDDPGCVSQEAAVEWGETYAGAVVIRVLRDGEWVQEIS